MATLLIRECHEKLGHLGTTVVLGELRQRYWIVRGTAIAKAILHKCVICRKVRGPQIHQKMADLPKVRVNEGDKAFTNCGLEWVRTVFGKKRSWSGKALRIYVYMHGYESSSP